MIRIGCLVDKGEFRDKNDDRATIGNKVIVDGYYETTFEKDCNVAVFDGVGGEKNSDIAASMAAQHFAKNSSPLGEDKLESLLETINLHIIKEQKRDISKQRMSTTVAGLIINDESVIVFNIGDSDVYGLRNGFLALLTQRHKMADILGTAIDSPKGINGNTLLRYLGGNYSKPFIKKISYPISSSGCFVLCTDGISDCVSYDEFETIITRKTPIKEKCKEINKTAKINGSKDNLTVMIIQGDSNENTTVY